MKRIFYLTLTVVTLGFLFSCEPVEDRESLPAITLTPETLNFSVVQNPLKNNEVTFTNLDPKVIPYWSYSDGNGELGHYNSNVQKVFLPFAGTYTVNFTALTPGGSVYAKPVTVVVDQNDSAYFSDPRWGYLTNGEDGKTWVLDMVKPLSFLGKPEGYVNIAVSGEGWYPFLSEIPWAGLEDKNWGEVTFNLDGGYNVSVTQTSPVAGSTAQTTTKGSYTFQLTDDSVDDKLIFNGGLEMLHPNEASYFSPSFSFSNIKIVQLTDDSLCYIAIRADNDWLIYHFIPKPTPN